jgi:hypothetical protein
MSRKLERFASIPLRVYDALERDELSVDEFTFLALLAGKANYRAKPPEFIATLTLIRELLQWSKSDEALRQLLHRLEAKSWINLEVTQGQRRAFLVQLAGLVCLPWRPLGGSLEVGSPTWKSEPPANPHGEKENGNSPPSQLGSPQITDADADSNADADIGTAFVNDGEADADPFDPLSALVSQIRDRDERTEATLRKHFGEGKLPEGAFRAAREALESRRQRKPPLESEASYVYSTLTSMVVQGQYR